MMGIPFAFLLFSAEERAAVEDMLELDYFHFFLYD